MKRIIVLLLAIVPMYAIAAEPSILCPSGYQQLTKSAITISDDACPAGHTSVATARACDSVALLVNKPQTCIMFAPANTNYSDRTGTYVYTESCPYVAPAGILP